MAGAGKRVEAAGRLGKEEEKEVKRGKERMEEKFKPTD